MRRRKLARTALSAAPYALLAASLGLYAVSAVARPGGGQSFGGRGGSSSGGGGGGDCGFIVDILGFLIQLTFEHPAVGVPLDIVIVVAIVVGLQLNKKKDDGWSTTAAASIAQLRVRPSRAIRRDLLASITRTDPEFSLVLFEDFAYALFAAVHEARGKGQLETLAPYLRPGARQELSIRGAPGEVRTPVIGALRYHDLQSGAGGFRVTLDFEANYTEVSGGHEQTFYVQERWVFSRAPTARSRPPEKASIIGCPNCGAPLSSIRGSKCNYCGKIVDTGQFDWMIESVQELDRMPRPPQLTSDTAEKGTLLPSVVEPDAGWRMHALTQKDPTFSWPHFLSRVGLIFTELQPAWSTLEWQRARPFVSDQLFQMLAYWIESYRRAGLRNITQNARITGIELSSVVSDRHFDAITVRVRATGLDYTIRDSDKQLVSGSSSRERPYSEYWTLIRGAGARARDVSDKACPNCGAPLAIAMSGNCTHCNAKVTSGQFDWVLSRIEQDEAYTG